MQRRSAVGVPKVADFDRTRIGLYLQYAEIVEGKSNQESPAAIAPGRALKDGIRGLLGLQGREFYWRSHSARPICVCQ